MSKLSVRDLEVEDKRVLVRVDFNVPLEEEGGSYIVSDDTRIRESLLTINHLRQRGAKVILMSHLGRPKGQKVEKYSLRPAGQRLSELLGMPVAFSTECIGDVPQKITAHMRKGDVTLLENVRFHPEEEANDPAFARGLAELGDIYVDDAFGSAHRAHASTEGVARILPAAAGFLMEKELQFLGEKLENPERPFVVVLGGAKVSDKITVIDSLLDRADTILIGGAMAYTFYLAQGCSVGASLCEPEKIGIAKAALKKAEERDVKFLLPVDSYVAENVDLKGRKMSPGKFVEQIPNGWVGVDIGPETVRKFRGEILGARTIFWNGPMGIFEIGECSKGTFAIAEAIGANAEAISIVGGGDSVKAVRRAGMADRVTFISTGGGASLELLEGKELPGVAALATQEVS